MQGMQYNRNQTVEKRMWDGMKKNRYKVFAVMLCVVLLLTGCTKKSASYAPIAPLEFPNLNWGLSIEQVEGVYGELTEVHLSKLKGTGGYSLIEYEGEAQMFEKTAELSFSFFVKEDQSYLCAAHAEFSDFKDAAAVDAFIAENLQPIIDNADREELYQTTEDLTEEEYAKWEANVAKVGIATRPGRLPLYMQKEAQRITVHPVENATVYYAKLSISPGYWCMAYLDFE